jgi:hypothetical protein
VLALAAANAVGVVLFGTLYAVAGARVLSQGAFLVCLLVVFVLVTALWVRTEARHRSLDPLRRIARIVIGLVIVLIVTPAAVLAPLFWLDQQLPDEVGLRAIRGGIMAVVLITLALLVAVNVVGSIVAVTRGALARQ